MSLLEVDKIAVSYGNVQVLWDVSFRVDDGELVSLIGSNGSGKTTTLKTIMGLLRPASGQISFLGERIDQSPTSTVVDKGIVYVPEGRGIFPRMAVTENLVMGAYSKRARSSLKENLRKAYEFFPLLKERETQLAGSLSGGEMQMLAVARALMGEPRLLMLDEPSSGLAPMLVHLIFKTCKQIHDRGTTILLVEQDAGRALSISDHAYVLETGRLILNGTGAQLMSNDYVREAYLGM